MLVINVSKFSMVKDSARTLRPQELVAKKTFIVSDLQYVVPKQQNIHFFVEIKIGVPFHKEFTNNINNRRRVRVDETLSNRRDHQQGIHSVIA